MQDTTEQSMIEVGTTATVTYDKESFQITTYVIVSPDPDNPTRYILETPPICLPGPDGATWRVLWNLFPTDGLIAQFTDPGIQIPRPGTILPPGLLWSPTGFPLNSNQWELAFSNDVPGVGIVLYDLDLAVTDSGGNPLEPSDRRDIVIDPTIAIVQEPMGG